MRAGHHRPESWNLGALNTGPGGLGAKFETAGGKARRWLMAGVLQRPRLVREVCGRFGFLMAPRISS